MSQAEGTARVQDSSIHAVSGKVKEGIAAKGETGQWSLHRCQSMNWSAKTLVKTLGVRGAVFRNFYSSFTDEF